MKKKEICIRQPQTTMQEHLSKIMRDIPTWDDMKTTTDEVLGRATITGRKNGLRLSLTIDKSDIGETRTQSVYLDMKKKSDYKDEIFRLRQQGLKQQEIANRLGISQSLVSKLLNQK